MKFSSLAVAIVAIAFAEAHDVRVGNRERRYDSNVRIGSKHVDEPRGKPGKHERTKREHVKHNPKVDEPRGKPGMGKREHVRHNPKAARDDEPQLIFGGTGAQPGQYPYFVEYQSSTVCGGTLIAPGVVLSAAHCGDQTNQKVHVGAFDFRQLNNGAQEATVVQTVMHPQYDGNVVNDFMLMKLDSAVTIPNGNPISLTVNEDGNVPSSGQMLTTMGTGTTDQGGFAQSLLHVDVPVVDTNTCQWNFWGPQLHPDIMFCAGGVTGQDSCQGDSGGPIVLKEGNTHRLVGVVSFGSQCGTTVPGVYARVSGVMPWIKSVVCDQWSVSSASFCGGSPPSPTPPAPSSPTPPTGDCTNLAGWTDSFKDDCSYYENNAGACEQWGNDVGTGGKTPIQACCVCHGTTAIPTSWPSAPSAPSSPTFPYDNCYNEDDYTDSYGDDCSYYEDNFDDGVCEIYAYDNGYCGLSPVEACCVCQGTVDGSPFGPTSPGDCINIPGWRDSTGSSCQFYELSYGACEEGKDEIGTGGKTPAEACCACK